MSSSTFTSNYHLSQFQPEDTPDWLADYNSDMLRIDSALKDISGVAEPVAAGLAALTTRVEQEEAANELQTEQLEYIMTGLNRVQESDNKQTLTINALNGRVNTAENRITALEDKAPDTANELVQLRQDITGLETTVSGHATAIATAQADIVTAQQTANSAITKMNDFNMITETDFTPAAQVTGTVKLRTTWHNLRQVMVNAELHEIANIEHVTDVGYVLASAEGKIFNTHWPEGSTEEPNTTFNTIGTINAAGAALDSATPQTLLLGWHYDVTNNKTLLVMKPWAASTDFATDYQTGAVFGAPMAIYD